jgi:trigger factor
MKLLSNKKTETNTVELEIAVSPEKLNEAMQKVYRRQSKNITVAGFRKGKAPRQIIERMYGDDVFLEDAVNDLCPEIYEKAIEEAGVDPVDQPKIEVLSASKAEGFTINAIVTVRPEVTLGEYKGLAVEKIIHPASDHDVEHELGHLRERNSRVLTVQDRPAAAGDTVVIDYEGSIDGVLFEGGAATDHSLKLGSGSFIDTFEDQIAGHSTGEDFEVNVTFPEEYHAPELAGKPAVFKVKLHSIEAQELPELDDEFAKDVSEFDTLEELRADLRKNLQETADRDSQTEMENKLLELICGGMQVELPVCMVEQRMDDMVRDFDYRLRSQGMNLEMYLQYLGNDMQAFREPMREQAEQQVKTRLALETIVELEHIVVSDEDVEAEYQRVASSYNMELKQVKEVLASADLARDLATNKALDLVRESAKVTEVNEQPAKPEKPAKKATAKKAAKKEEKPLKKASAKKADGEEAAKPKKKAAAKKADAGEAPPKKAPAKKTAKKKTEEKE